MTAQRPRHPHHWTSGPCLAWSLVLHALAVLVLASCSVAPTRANSPREASPRASELAPTPAEAAVHRWTSTSSATRSASSAEVHVYDARTGAWEPGRLNGPAEGAEAHVAGAVFRHVEGIWRLQGEASLEALHRANAAVSEVADTRDPRGDDWVLVLEGEEGSHHQRLHEMKAGGRFAFQGRVYETLGEARVEHVRETGEVIGRVVNTFVRTADAVIEVEVSYADGSRDTLTGTPNHPFWVPAVSDYVALEDLRVGTVLRTWGGSEATVLGLTWKPGEVEVHDIEVEGLRNFFVRGPGSDAPGVLVHNSTGSRVVRHGPMNPGPLADDIANTFRSGTYDAVTLGSDTRLYRVHGGTAGELGGFWTTTPPTGPTAARIDLALKPEWGNTANKVSSILVPRGTTIYSGPAAAQGGLVGGGTQVFIPKVEASWLVP